MEDPGSTGASWAGERDSTPERGGSRELAGLGRGGVGVHLDYPQQAIDVDLTGPLLLTREFAAHVIQSKVPASVVVNISSIARHGNPGQSNYSAAMAGLMADTKLRAIELARYGIRTGAIAPGFVETPILKEMRPEVLEGMIKPVPLGRLGKPEEMFAALKFIVECDYFTGRCIDVDGGLTL